MFNTQQDAYMDFRSLATERTTPILLWIGSGLSCTAGIPDWRQLHSKLVDALKNKAGTLADKEAKHLSDVANIAAKQTNYWTAFELLRNTLGVTTYAATIRKALNAADTCAVPAVHKLLWKLRPKGILTLNLDRLAVRARGTVEALGVVHEFTGHQCGNFAHILQSPRPFVANLHGILADESSWVFTKPELRKLLKTDSYKQFLSACLTTHTVLFLGITADDLAVGGHLAALSKMRYRTQPHYWMTPRTDSTTDSWAERVGIRVIRYSAANNDHSACVEMLEDILSYLPEDPSSTPVIPQQIAKPLLETIPEPAELTKYDSEDIRMHLNIHAMGIFESDQVDSLRKYNDFCAKYDPAIYRAWYVSTQPPHDTLLGYTITSTIAKGAFGTVYTALTPDRKKTVAIKVLHQEVRQDPDMLQSFRRGVKSMHILSEHQVEGMVECLEAAEIPTLVVMELVEGPDLRQAVEKRSITTWGDVLKISLSLARIIRTAHFLPERVLHRDIRPSNIMLRGLYTGADWEVVVLDFDLSWHKGAFDVSVTNPNAMSGFLAPEQVRRTPNVSTRSAAVDSYGLGMTLFYLRTGQEPVFSQHQHANWANDLQNAYITQSCPQWKSLPRRFARLIECATRHAQCERWDMTQIFDELTRLDNALQGKPVSTELTAEEIVANTQMYGTYEWDADRLLAEVQFPTGLTVSVRGIETEQYVEVKFAWVDMAIHPIRHVQKWLPRAEDQIKSVFRKAGWQIEGKSVGGTLNFVAKCSLVQVRKNVTKAASVIDEAIAKCQLR